MQPAIPQPTERVFLSYSHNDRAAAIVLRAALEKAGLSVFKDDDSLRGGDRWLERLQQVLNGCSAFVVLAGRDGVRRWVGAEVQVALIRHLSSEKDDERLPIFPILLEEVAPETLPPFLALFQASRWRAAEALPAGLIDAISAHAIRLDSPPAIEGCPFVGLNAFTSKDARLFFGRRKETLEALDLPRRPAAGQSGRPARRRWPRLLPLAADRGQQRHRQVVAGQRRHAADDRTGRAVGAHRLRALAHPRPDDAGQGPA
jgi:hypothetical protein